MSIVFLFGAGASYGSGECYPHPPPLGNTLLPELLRRGAFGAPTDDEYVRQLFENKTFEEGMQEFFDTSETRVPAVLREMSK